MAGKGEKKQSLLVKISQFKEPLATDFGGVLTVFIPIIVGIYAILLIIGKANESNVVSETRFLKDGEDFFKINITCTFPQGCVVYEPYEAETVGWSQSLTIMEKDQRIEYAMYFDTIFGSLAVAPRVCWFGAPGATCDGTNTPRFNDPAYWKNQTNASRLPALPVSFSTALNENESKRSGPIWAASLTLYGKNDTMNVTKQGASVTESKSQLDTDSQDFLSWYVDYGEGETFEERKKFFNKVCPSTQYIPESCGADNIMDDEAVVAYFMTINIAGSYSIDGFKTVDVPAMALEIAGQLGGAYGLIMSVLGAIYKVYIFLTKKKGSAASKGDDNPAIEATAEMA